MIKLNKKPSYWMIELKKKQEKSKENKNHIRWWNKKNKKKDKKLSLYDKNKKTNLLST
jgi:hypothetical protein